MSSRFEEIDRRQTPIGEISVRRRPEPTLQIDVYEVKLGDEFLMSSLFTVAEIELARLALAEVVGSDLDVVVGGLGYTERAVLENSRVRSMHIIVALAGGEKHGYAIMRDVETLSDGTVHMGPGTRYGSIKRMINQGLVEETEERPDPAFDDQRRRYYRLTNLGERASAAEQARLSRLLSAAQFRRLGLGLGGAT